MTTCEHGKTTDLFADSTCPECDARIRAEAEAVRERNARRERIATAWVEQMSDDDKRAMLRTGPEPWRDGLSLREGLDKADTDAVLDLIYRLACPDV